MPVRSARPPTGRDVLLADVLETAAELKDGARHVWFEGHDEIKDKDTHRAVWRVDPALRERSPPPVRCSWPTG